MTNAKKTTERSHKTAIGELCNELNAYGVACELERELRRRAKENTGFRYSYLKQAAFIKALLPSLNALCND